MNFQSVNFKKLYFFCLCPAEGKPIPTELRNEEAALRHQIDLEDESTAGMGFWAFSSMRCLIEKKKLVAVFFLLYKIVENFTKLTTLGALSSLLLPYIIYLFTCPLYYNFDVYIQVCVIGMLFKSLCPVFCFIVVPRTHIDDEYANASEKDPKILLTTSRDPSAPLIQFTKVLLLHSYCLLFVVNFDNRM